MGRSHILGSWVLLGRENAWLQRWALAVLAVVGTLVLVGVLSNVRAAHESTNASWWGSNWPDPCTRAAGEDSQCVANNTLHLYLLNSGLTTARRNAAIRGFTLYNDNTEVSAVQVTSDWDVYVTQESWPLINAYAFTKCAPAPAPPLPDPLTYGGSATSHTRWCRPQWFVWNTYGNAGSRVDSTAKYNYIGCHEVGHTIGLRHRTSGSCMFSPSLGPLNAGGVVPSTENPTAGDYDRVDRHYPL